MGKRTFAVAGNNIEPDEPQLQKLHEDWNSVLCVKHCTIMLQSVTCRSSEREDDVKDTQRQAQTPASHNAVERVMAEKRNGSRTGV